MIDIRGLTAIVQSATALAVLLILMLKLWPCLRLAEFRQAMFVIRDELFDYAASGRIEFTHPAYRLLRRSMNGFIRYGHQLTFFRLLLTLIQWKALRQNTVFTWASQWDAALETIPDDAVRKQLRSFHARTLALVSNRLVTGSPVLMTALGIMVLITLFQMQWDSLKTVIRRSLLEMINRIVDPRLLEEEAFQA
jgi:hypothetical protein